MATVDLQNDVNRFPSFLAYDPAAGTPVVGEDNNTSKVFQGGMIVAIEGMVDVELTSVTVQTKVHKDGVWHDYQVVDKSVANAWVEFLQPPNYVRVKQVPVGGTSNYKVYMQTDHRDNVR